MSLFTFWALVAVFGVIFGGAFVGWEWETRERLREAARLEEERKRRGGL